MSISNPEIIDEVHRRDPDEVLRDATHPSIPPETRRDLLPRILEAIEDMNNNKQERWYQANKRYEKDLKTARQQRVRRIIAGLAVGLVAVVGGTKTFEHLNKAPAAGVTAENHETGAEYELPIWTTFRDHDVNTIAELSQKLTGNGNVEAKREYIRTLNPRMDWGEIQLDDMILVGTSYEDAEHYSELGFQVHEVYQADETEARPAGRLLPATEE